jgi:hypothetical protein
MILASASFCSCRSLARRSRSVFSPLRFEDALGDLANDDAVQLVHADAHALTRGRAFLELPRAAVIAIGPALAGVLLFLVLNKAEKEWTMPAREWSIAKAQFAILFGERFTRAMA